MINFHPCSPSSLWGTATPAWGISLLLCRLAVGTDGLQLGPRNLLSWPFYILPAQLHLNFPSKTNSNPTGPWGNLLSSWTTSNCPSSVILISFSSLLICSGSYLDCHSFYLLDHSVHTLMSGPPLVCFFHRALNGLANLIVPNSSLSSTSYQLCVLGNVNNLPWASACALQNGDRSNAHSYCEWVCASVTICRQDNAWPSLLFQIICWTAGSQN